MCWCDPNIRTPQCRSINCVPPKQEVNVGTTGHPDLWSPNAPQTDMFEKEFATELLKRVGILDKDGNIAEQYKA